MPLMMGTPKMVPLILRNPHSTARLEAAAAHPLQFHSPSQLPPARFCELHWQMCHVSAEYGPIVPLNEIERSFGYIIIRPSYTPYSIYLTGTIESTLYVPSKHPLLGTTYPRFQGVQGRSWDALLGLGFGFRV